MVKERKVIKRIRIAAGFLIFVSIYFVFFSGKFKSRSVKDIDVPVCDIFSPDILLNEVKRSKIKNLFGNLMNQGVFNGNVIYTENGEVIYQDCFGYSDMRGKKNQLTSNSTFQLASVSKMFSALGIMILQEEGKLKYDDQVRKFISGFPYKNITIRHLLNHRSGLPRYMSLADKNCDREKLFTNRAMVNLFVRLKPKLYFQPGSEFHYCNTNYALLACIIESVSKLGFDKFIQSRIFDPAGMEHSFIYNHRGLSELPGRIDKGTTGHIYRNGKPGVVTDNYLNGVMGDKGVYTSIIDLHKFDSALTAGVFVNSGTLAEGFLPGGYEGSGRKSLYGFGWRIPEGMDSTVYHFCWWKGFRSYYIRDMARNRTLIVLCNNTKGISPSILWDIINRDYFPELLGIYGKLREDNELSVSARSN
ncbi:MAG: beta-lactamase family protein [Bacteroidales bacterium]|nr:beta-lactamase family protein [Bacteroidales bacterium]